LADLTADVALTSPSITWQGLTAANASASAVVTSIAVDVQQMEFDIEGGHINGSALVPFGADAPARANLGWTSVPAIPIVRALAPATPVLPATVTSGMVTAEGPLATLAQWAADGRVRLVPLSNARGRIALGRQADLRLRAGSWRLIGEDVVGGVAPLRLVVRGPVDGGGLLWRGTLARTGI